MEMHIEVQDDKVCFIKELLEGLSFVNIKRSRESEKVETSEAPYQQERNGQLTFL
ncbi:MAG: hypothetical protein ACX93T_03345 [Bacteroidota bacterium]